VLFTTVHSSKRGDAARCDKRTSSTAILDFDRIMGTICDEHLPHFLA